MKALALTNINSTADLWDFVELCQQSGIKPVAGAEIRNESTLLYLLIAKNNEGLIFINRFLSQHNQTATPFPARPEHSEEVFVVYPLGSVEVSTLCANELVGIQTTEINKLFAVDVAAAPDKYVIRHPVTFQNKTWHNVHRLLRAIDKNIFQLSLWHV